MTSTELERTMRLLEPMYDMVRVVDPSVTEGRTLTEDGVLDAPHSCFGLLKKGRRCKNCISARTIHQKRSISKFEFVGRDAYYISTRYVEVEGKPLALEFVKHIDDGTLVDTDDAESTNQLQKLKDKSEDRLLKDKKTDAYNRNYLDDGVGSLDGSEVAMLRAIGLGSLEGIDGTDVRSVILSAISSTIMGSINEVDTLVHFSEDTFVIIFEGVPGDVFKSRLESIRQRVVDALDARPETAGTDVVIGAVMHKDKVSELIARAEGALDAARQRHVPLVLIKDDSDEATEAHELIEPVVGARATQVDALTGLPSPHVFRGRLQKAIDVFSPEDTLYVMHFDIENFKSYNRAFGLPEGDVLLVKIARALTREFEGDALCRIGTDMFCVASTRTDSFERIETMQSELTRLRRGVGLELKCGVYQIRSAAMDATRAMDRAKIACESIKGKYDRMVKVFDELMQRTVTMRNYLVKSLDKAIEQGYIRPYYQAIVRSFTGRACSMEALARWQDPTYGTISPADVIPTLEAAHLIHKHDVHIVRCVCQDLRTRLDQGLTVVPVSVNLSRLDFELCDIFEEVEAAVREFNIDRSLLGIEVTESTLDLQNAVFRPQVERFRQAGYEIWMDDFGSGYSSLNVLKDYDFDVLKIDMAFLRGLEDNQNSREILSSIVSMSKRIGVRTLAEGVETQAQHTFLKTIGCEMIQGFLFSRPMPLDHLDVDLKVEMEDERDRLYLDSVGRVNLLSAETAHAVNPAANEATGLPLALMDFDGRRFRYFTANEAYRRHILSRGIPSISEAECLINGDEAQLARFVDIAHTLERQGGERTVSSTFGNVTQTSTVRFVAKGNDSSAFLVCPQKG